MIAKLWSTFVYQFNGQRTDRIRRGTISELIVAKFFHLSTVLFNRVCCWRPYSNRDLADIGAGDTVHELVNCARNSITQASRHR